jgi:heme/copper-type cytochrome/quinol oxidase subunit 2
MRILNRLRPFLIAALLGVLVTTVAQACPTCKEGMVEGGNQAGMIRGYFWSILFMMSMPFLIFSGLGAYFYLQVKRSQLERSESVVTQ